MTSTALLFAGLVSLQLTNSVSVSAARTPVDVTLCAATSPIPVLSVVGPMVGDHSAWMVDGFARLPTNTPVKTLWVIAQPAQGVEIIGHRRGGSEVVAFQREPGAITDKLTIADAGRESVRPGGATEDVLQGYAFIPSYVHYPVAGCWEFTVTAGGRSSRIVRSVEVRP